MWHAVLVWGLCRKLLTSKSSHKKRSERCRMELGVLPSVRVTSNALGHGKSNKLQTRGVVLLMVVP